MVCQHSLFSNSVTEKVKVIIRFFKINLFVNINSCNQYNYFLKLEKHQIHHCIPSETIFPSKQSRPFEKLDSPGNRSLPQKSLDVSEIWTMDGFCQTFSKKIYLFKPLHKVSRQQDIYFKSQCQLGRAFLHLSPTHKNPSQNRVKR